jgi:hypothetical protein
MVKSIFNLKNLHLEILLLIFRKIPDLMSISKSCKRFEILAKVKFHYICFNLQNGSLPGNKKIPKIEGTVIKFGEVYFKNNKKLNFYQGEALSKELKCVKYLEIGIKDINNLKLDNFYKKYVKEKQKKGEKSKKFFFF